MCRSTSRQHELVRDLLVVERFLNLYVFADGHWSDVHVPPFRMPKSYPPCCRLRIKLEERPIMVSSGLTYSSAVVRIPGFSAAPKT